MHITRSYLIWIVLIIFFALVALTPNLDIFAAERQPGVDSTVYLPLAMRDQSVSSGTGGTLVNGGTVIGLEGVRIGALTTSLAQPVAINISSAATPTTTFPSSAQPVGNFYQISAITNTFTAPGSPLMLGLPVPVGAVTETLALGMLQSGVSAADAGDNLQAWSFLEGEYIASLDLFVTTSSGLLESGRTFVLTNHADFATSNHQNSNFPDQAATPSFDLFNVKCLNFTSPGDCTSTTESTIQGYLTDIYDHLVNDLGFIEPRLRNLAENLSFDPHSLSSLGYTVYIEPYDYGFCASEPAAGYYDRDLGRLVLCYNPGVGVTPDTLYTLIHEYFHSTEYAYPEFLNDYKAGHKEGQWLVEGMAMSAEESYFVAPMTRSNNGTWIKLHKLDVSMESDAGLDEYFAQDFWVFSGLYMGYGLSYLEDTLMAGGEADEVATVLGDGERLKLYWEWAKNQAIEKTFDFNGKLGTPCQIENQVIDTPELFPFDFFGKISHDVSLGPLTSVAIEITWDYPYDLAAGYVFSIYPAQRPAADQALEYKFYKNGEGGCEGIPERDRIFENVDPGVKYYVLIANTDVKKTFDYRVFFEVAPVPTR